MLSSALQAKIGTYGVLLFAKKKLSKFPLYYIESIHIVGMRINYILIFKCFGDSRN